MSNMWRCYTTTGSRIWAFSFHSDESSVSVNAVNDSWILRCGKWAKWMCLAIHENICCSLGSLNTSIQIEYILNEHIFVLAHNEAPVFVSWPKQFQRKAKRFWMISKKRFLCYHHATNCYIHTLINKSKVLVISASPLKRRFIFTYSKVFSLTFQQSSERIDNSVPNYRLAIFIQINKTTVNNTLERSNKLMRRNKRIRSAPYCWG